MESHKQPFMIFLWLNASENIKKNQIVFVNDSFLTMNYEDCRDS